MANDFGDFDFGEDGGIAGLDFDSGVATAIGSSFPKMEDLVGCLLLMRPYETGERQSTAPNAKPGDMYRWVETDTHVVALGEEGWHPRTGTTVPFFDGEKVPMVLLGFQFSGQQVSGFLLQQLKRGKWAVGVLIEGERKRRDRNPPWVLDTPTPEQVEQVKEYIVALQEEARAKAQQRAGDIFAS